MADAWDEATYAGKERAQRSRIARLTPQERLAWLECYLVELEAVGRTSAYAGDHSHLVA